jgi:hypothetical protein
LEKTAFKLGSIRTSWHLGCTHFKLRVLEFLSTAISKFPLF